MNKQKTVLLGLSGGVDSAVAALRLKQKGYKVIGAFMINFSETKNPITHDCNYLEDKKEAQKIATILKIPLKIFEFQKEYSVSVLKPMFKSYYSGLTPNPDSLCNKVIKFPLLWKEAKKLRCNYIATGHYIKKIKKKERYYLKIPKDKSKDQSYFLYNLKQKDLPHILFPISNLTKSEVRKIAKKNKFPNHKKKSTSGICFVGKINMKQFLKQKISQKPGNIISPEGETIGKHQGIQFYTIGERIGESPDLTVNKEFRNKIKKKLYVANKNSKNNTLIVAPKNHRTLKKDKFKIIKVNWISYPPSLPLTCKVRIRHQGKLHSSKLDMINNSLICNLNNSIKSIAPGQSCVIYKNSTILGGGEIRFK
jgi:tRNA-uridine 2-sulfurtransferase